MKNKNIDSQLEAFKAADDWTTAHAYNKHGDIIRWCGHYLSLEFYSIIVIVLDANRPLARITLFTKHSYFLVPIEPVLNLTFRLILMFNYRCLI